MLKQISWSWWRGLGHSCGFAWPLPSGAKLHDECLERDRSFVAGINGDKTLTRNYEP
jgi:hypothetical protein